MSSFGQLGFRNFIAAIVYMWHITNNLYAFSAALVQRFCNQQVIGSSPIAGSPLSISMANATLPRA
jgi:hypothetical protein